MQDPSLGKGAELVNVHRGGIGAQLQRRAADINTIKGRGGGVQRRATAPHAPAAVFHQLQLAAVAVERGDLPRERRFNIDNQVAAGAELSQRQALQPVGQRRHPQLLPVGWQRIFQPGERRVIQHQRMAGAQPVAGRAHHPALPA